MATTTPPAPNPPTDDNDARLAVSQILGSDIDHTWTGNWHDTLRTTAARWADTTITVGDRIELTTDIHALNTRHQAGQQGTVQAMDPDGYLTVRMDDGRTAFPHHTEVDPPPAAQPATTPAA
jgi:hypothetical protein